MTVKKKTEPPPNRSLCGRLLVYIPFFAVTLWLAVSLLAGFALELYGQPPHGDAVAQRRWCLRQISGLHAELETGIKAALAEKRPRPTARWRDWSLAWRKRFDTAQAICASDSPDVDPQPTAMSVAFGQLAVLYSEYDGGAAKILSSRADLGRELDQAVRSLLAKD